MTGLVEEWDLPEEFELETVSDPDEVGEALEEGPEMEFVDSRRLETRLHSYQELLETGGYSVVGVINEKTEKDRFGEDVFDDYLEMSVTEEEVASYMEEKFYQKEEV